MYELRFWADARGKHPVVDWFKSLAKPQARTVARLFSLLKEKGPNLPPPYAKNLGAGLWELRDASTGPGMRVYYCFHAEKVIVLVASGQKSTQARDIERARGILNDIK